MRIRIISVIKRQEPHLAAIESDYLKRIRRFLPCDVIEVKRKEVTGAHSEKLLKVEAKRIENVLKEGEFVVLLSEKGKELSSGELAHFMNSRMKNGKRSLAFVIGGPVGLSRDLALKANEHLSLSRLTFPHKLVRLILLEAIYRAVEILRGGPYPK